MGESYRIGQVTCKPWHICEPSVSLSHWGKAHSQLLRGTSRPTCLLSLLVPPRNFKPPHLVNHFRFWCEVTVICQAETVHYRTLCYCYHCCTDYEATVQAKSLANCTHYWWYCCCNLRHLISCQHTGKELVNSDLICILCQGDITTNSLLLHWPYYRQVRCQATDTK